MVRERSESECYLQWQKLVKWDLVFNDMWRLWDLKVSVWSPPTCRGGPELGASPHDVRTLHRAKPRRALLHRSREATQGGRGERAVQVRSERGRQGALRVSGDGPWENWSGSFQQDWWSRSQRIIGARDHCLWKHTPGHKRMKESEEETAVLIYELQQRAWCLRWSLPLAPSGQWLGSAIGRYSVMISYESLGEISQERQTLLTDGVPVMRVTTWGRQEQKKTQSIYRHWYFMCLKILMKTSRRFCQIYRPGWLRLKTSQRRNGECWDSRARSCRARN